MKEGRVGRIFIGLGFLILIAIGSAAILGIRPPHSHDPSKDSSTGGFSFLLRIIAKLGYAPRSRPGSAFRDQQGGTALFLGFPDWEEDEYDAFLSWVEGGGRAFCFGGEDNLWVGDTAYAYSDQGLLKLRALADGSNYPLGLMGQVFSALPEDAGILLSNEEGEAVLALLTYGEGELYLGSDSVLLNNRAIRSGGEDYAAFLNRLFLPGFGDTFTLYIEKPEIQKASDPIQALFRGELLPLSLQFLLIYLIASAVLALRFGSTATFGSRARRLSREHVDAVGRFYLRALHPLGPSRGLSPDAAGALGVADLADAAGAAEFRAQLESLFRKAPGASDQELVEACRSALPASAPAESILELLRPYAGLSDSQMRARALARAQARAAIRESLQRSLA